MVDIFSAVEDDFSGNLGYGVRIFVVNYYQASLGLLHLGHYCYPQLLMLLIISSSIGHPVTH